MWLNERLLDGDNLLLCSRPLAPPVNDEGSCVDQKFPVAFDVYYTISQPNYSPVVTHLFPNLILFLFFTLLLHPLFCRTGPFPIGILIVVFFWGSRPASHHFFDRPVAPLSISFIARCRTRTCSSISSLETQVIWHCFLTLLFYFFGLDSRRGVKKNFFFVSF